MDNQQETCITYHVINGILRDYTWYTRPAPPFFIRGGGEDGEDIVHMHMKVCI